MRKCLVGLVLFSFAIFTTVFASNDLSQVMKEMEKKLTVRCQEKSVSNNCMGFCTYDMVKSFSYNNLKSLNPDWLIVNSLIPGKCYVSELGKVFPALIDFSSTEKCCDEHRKADAWSNSIQFFISTTKFDRVPAIKHVKAEPNHCVVKACSGKTFDMKFRDIIACENTFLTSFICYFSQIFKETQSLLQAFGSDSFNRESIKKTITDLMADINKPEAAKLLKIDGIEKILTTKLSENVDTILQSVNKSFEMLLK